jgi:hypothetical protein
MVSRTDLFSEAGQLTDDVCANRKISENGFAESAS